MERERQRGREEREREREREEKGEREKEREEKNRLHQQEMSLDLMLQDVHCWTIFIKEIAICHETIKEFRQLFPVDSVSFSIIELFMLIQSPQYSCQ